MQAPNGGAAAPPAQHQPRRWSMVMLLEAAESKVIAQTWLLGSWVQYSLTRSFVAF